jgi:hypothetical protein
VQALHFQVQVLDLGHCSTTWRIAPQVVVERSAFPLISRWQFLALLVR